MKLRIILWEILSGSLGVWNCSVTYIKYVYGWKMENLNIILTDS